MDYKYIGKSVPRIDGKEKVSGAAIFGDDIDFGANLLYAEIISSTKAHALIKSIDTSRAEKLEGVVKVFTGKDFPFKFGLYMKDRYVFAQDRVRFVGEQVAAVVARTPQIAKRAALLIEIEYEALPVVLDQMDALKDGAVLLHPDLADYPHVPWFFPKEKTNIAHWRKTRKGDLEKGFADADVILEETYEVPRYAHCAIETHVAIGKYDLSGRLTVWSSSQSPHTQRHLFAEALAPLGLTHKDVRVIAPHVGGGFGGKAGVTMEIIPAALATKLKGYAVKLRWTREQEFVNTYQRLGVVAKLKIGVKNDGTITALDHKIYWDAGAYVEYGANVVNAVGLSAIGPYRIPNVSIDSVCVYTNLPPGGAYRGFGYSEMLFGLESLITTVANKIGMDEIAFRRHNAILEGDTTAYGVKMNPNGLLEAIDKVKKAIDWDKKLVSKDPTKALGKGFSLFWKAPAMPPNASSSAFLKFNEDASINLIISGMDIGQGYQTVMAQIAAEILSVPPDKIRVETPDTDRNPYEWQTVASHITWSSGNAVKKAAIDAREQIFALVHRVFNLPIDELFLEDEAVKCNTDKSFNLPLRSFIVEGIATKDGTYKGGPINGRGMFMPEYSSAAGDPETSQGGHPNVHYTVGAGALILEIDKETGKMKVLKVAEAIDAGKAINPDLIKGQITGGLLQGLATVLYEDMRYDKHGRLLNPNFTDYKIPTSMDVPDEIIPIIVEVPQPDGPFGARGIGEHTMLPAAPMIANAVFDALGIRIRQMPITAEKVALAILDKGGKTDG
ncbi:MAG: xanthine dehydrogenase family protein molybdopterin-binding subunit [Candidatus Cloacimonadaceae bacterium]|nr:xanthine dehydrogenase family protein molybdopterin-binding subunit [Candidatus Cloacimonadaceae bacterium]MDP3113783.1 xanthine dehydrogenase family protein molybdopterin-binding subunit [Candidatus Cloacimonadaceae bacterium]